MGGELRYVLSVENASLHWASQWKAFFITWKNGRYFSLDLDTKRLLSQSNVEFLLVFEGGCMFSTDFILSGFASIPRLLTMKPKNFSTETPKVHLVGFNFMLL